MNTVLILTTFGLIGFGGLSTCAQQTNPVLPKYEVGQCLADVEGIGRINLATISKVTNRNADEYELTWILLNGRAPRENYRTARIGYVDDQKYFIAIDCKGDNR